MLAVLSGTAKVHSLTKMCSDKIVNQISIGLKIYSTAWWAIFNCLV